MLQAKLLLFYTYKLITNYSLYSNWRELTDSSESNSASVAKTVAPDFESNCVSEEKAEFNLVAEEGFEPPTFGL